MRNKEVQIIPWVNGDSTFVRCSTSRMDASKTVFVGALHGMLSAECLSNIFQDLFKGVVYAGIDTDKYKYPIGSGRVVFNNTHSYMKAVSAAFIEIKTAKFTKKVMFLILHCVPVVSGLCQKYAFTKKNLQFLPDHYETLSK